MSGRKNQVGIGRFLWYLAAVPRCMVCRRPLTWEEILPGYAGCDVLCPDCRARWEEEKLNLCESCGLPAMDCRCLPRQLREESAMLLRLGVYTGGSAIGRFLLRLKDVPLKRAVDFAAVQLLPAVKRCCAERGIRPEDLLVTYLPRTRAARRRAGHDQAELLAAALAERLGAEMQPLIYRRTGNRAQKKLSWKKRIKNAETSFGISDDLDLSGRCLLLCDDVVTSGSSMQQGLRLLRRAGAEDVICLSLAVSTIDFLRQDREK